MRIAIDYDGTIADTNREKSLWIREHLGLDVPPWDCNRTDCVPLICLEAYEAMGEWVYADEGSSEALPVPGALEALRELTGAHELFVLSARSVENLEYSRMWLEARDAAGLFSGFHSSSGTTKGAVCRSIGAEVLIDDDSRHLSAQDLAWLIRVLLQHGREEAPERAPGVTFCRSWGEVIGILGR